MQYNVVNDGINPDLFSFYICNKKTVLNTLKKNFFCWRKVKFLIMFCIDSDVECVIVFVFEANTSF